MQLAKGKSANGSNWALEQWPPAGSMGSLQFGTPPFGKSVDMVDVCTQLMDGGATDPLGNMGSLRNDLIMPPDYAGEGAGGCWGAAGGLAAGVCAAGG